MKTTVYERERYEADLYSHLVDPGPMEVPEGLIALGDGVNPPVFEEPAGDHDFDPRVGRDTMAVSLGAGEMDISLVFGLNHPAERDRLSMTRGAMTLDEATGQWRRASSLVAT